MKHLNKPVVFIIFNRPEKTADVFKAIQQAKPNQLFIVADGPRHTEDEAKCEATRKCLDNIDWPCEVYRNYSDHNLGCRKRVETGLDWVFSHVEEAIIVEDDCLATPSFFTFCSELLDYYRLDSRIWTISGDNFQHGHWRGDGSYYFSRYPHYWGWATWKRAWKHYEKDLNSWPEVKNSGLLKGVLPNSAEYKYWRKIFDRLYSKNQPNSWGYRWVYTCWVNHAMSVLPNSNLVSNIGFGKDSTHTYDEDSSVANLPTSEISEIIHPSIFMRHDVADEFTFEEYLLKEYRKNNPLSVRFKGKFQETMEKIKSFREK